jgi:cytosine/adenosine deaminase-related metal-dependent hydrolase
MLEPDDSCTLTARWVVPVEGPPLQQGIITIDSGRIVRIDHQRQRKPDHDLGNAAILPGLVNAHTHLDLTGLRGRGLPTGSFTDWLRAVIGHRRSLSATQAVADVRAGLAEALSFGTTLLGDISGQGLSWPILAEAPLRSVVFYELLGLPRTRAQQAWAAACQWLREHRANTSCRPGLSPHAPYSVRGSLFRAAANLARTHLLPLAIHLAETTAEVELLQHHRGLFREFLSELGVWDEAGLVNGPKEVLRLNQGLAHALFVHGNYLDAAVPIPADSTIVYCPRTHAVFGHEPHPFRSFLAAGARVALGTDSLASNPDLDVLAEVRFLHNRVPDLAGDVLLRMATLNGAEALGWQAETGSLTPGKSADLVALALPADDRADPYAQILESTLPVQAVMLRGRWYKPPP